MSPRPSFNSTPVARVEVVTLTVFTSGTSTPPSQRSGGSASVPIAAIAGGTAGGVVLAVLLVLIWKYWGVVIKRDERKRRKEARDILTVRENTRRNATSGFKPQSQYRPMLALNPDGRRVTFLARAPTSSRKKQQHRGPSPAPAVPAAAEEKYSQGEGEEQAPTPTLAPAVEGKTRQPLSNLPPLVAPLETQDTSEKPLEDDDAAQTELPILTAVPVPAPASQGTTTLASTATATTTPDMAPAAHTPELSVPVRRVRTLGSSPGPTARSRTPSGSSSTHGHGHAAPIGGRQLPPPVPALPPISTVEPALLPAGASPPAPPAPSALSWATAARSSVLPSPPDRPVIMPRAKNAPLLAPSASSQQPASPVSLRPHIPSLASSASQYSANSGEPSVRRGFFNALRHKAVTQPGGSANVRRTSTYSSASAYSND